MSKAPAKTSPTDASPAGEAILVSGLSAAETEAVELFREQNGLDSLSDAVAALCRAALAGTCPAVPSPLRWEDRPDDVIHVMSASQNIGFISIVPDNRKVIWQIHDIMPSGSVRRISGNSASVAAAKRAFRTAWERWLADRGLQNVPAVMDPS